MGGSVGSVEAVIAAAVEIEGAGAMFSVAEMQEALDRQRADVKRVIELAFATKMTIALEAVASAANRLKTYSSRAVVDAASGDRIVHFSAPQDNVFKDYADAIAQARLVADCYRSALFAVGIDHEASHAFIREAADRVRGMYRAFWSEDASGVLASL